MIRIEKPASPHPFSSNTYIISSNDEYAVVDPSVPFSFFEIADKVKYILLTHSHFDHILDIDDWVKNTSAKVMISEYEIDFLSDPGKNCYRQFLSLEKGYFGKAHPLSDGDILKLGDEEIKVMLTDGHTRGSLCYLVSDVAFVGDTVFEGGGYGRFDLPSGDYLSLRRSIDRICELPSDMVLYPGHGYETSVCKFKKDFMI